MLYTQSAIAKDEVKPGLSIPINEKKLSYPSSCLIIKS